MSQVSQFLQKKENISLAKKLNVVVWLLTVIVLFLVGLMRQVKIDLPAGVRFDYLPVFHATLNCAAAISLVLAVISIKKGLVINHQRWIYAAMGCSIVFLLSYVLYHFTTPETLYGDANKDGFLSDLEIEEAGFMRKVYLTILLSHISLAAISLPFILLTFVYGFTNQFEKHRKFAKRVFPIWLYVAITGPVVYIMLQPYY